MFNLDKVRLGLIRRVRALPPHVLEIGKYYIAMSARQANQD